MRPKSTPPELATLFHPLERMKVFRKRFRLESFHNTGNSGLDVDRLEVGSLNDVLKFGEKLEVTGSEDIIVFH